MFEVAIKEMARIMIPERFYLSPRQSIEKYALAAGNISVGKYNCKVGPPTTVEKLLDRDVLPGKSHVFEVINSLETKA